MAERTWDRTELAWAAGLFEGEGCFSGHSNLQQRSPGAVLAMTDFDPVRAFARIVGVGDVYGPLEMAPPRQPQLRWQTNSHENFQQVVCLLWPWLHPRRRARAHELLSHYNSRPPRNVQGSKTRWVHDTPAYQMFGKRLKDLTSEERRLWDNAKSQAVRDARRASEGRESIEDERRRSIAFELFGKRVRDLTPAETTEYRRVQVARNRAKRKAAGEHRGQA